MIEPRHRAIRAILLRLLHSHGSVPSKLSSLKAVRISNNLYVNDITSEFEAAKVFLIQVYIKPVRRNGGKRSWPRLVTAINNDAPFLTLPEKSGYSSIVACECIRLPHSEESFGGSVYESIDALDESIDDLLNWNFDREDVVSDDDVDLPDSTQRTTYDWNFERTNETVPLPGDTFKLPVRRDWIQIYWPSDDIYYSRQVKEVLSDGSHVIIYDDNDKEPLSMKYETWCFENALEANSIELINSSSLMSKLFLMECSTYLVWNHFFYITCKGSTKL